MHAVIIFIAIAMIASLAGAFVVNPRLTRANINLAAAQKAFDDYDKLLMSMSKKKFDKHMKYYDETDDGGLYSYVLSVERLTTVRNFQLVVLLISLIAAAVAAFAS